MSVSNNQVANETTFNNAFVSRTVDTSTTGKLGLSNAASESGTAIVNTQRELNSLASFLGKALNVVKNALPSWTHNDVGASTDDVKTRADLLTAQFNPSTGHTHNGVDSAPVLASSLASVRLRGSFIQGANLTGVTGSSVVVTTQMAGKVASTGDTVKGVVVLANNQVVLRDATSATSGDQLKDSNGDLIYSRLTESGGVWTLSFYKNVSGAQTAHSFTSQSISWYYQELFNPITDAPIYSELAVIPSDNATQDVIAATTTQQGKVSLSAGAPPAVAATGSNGTANASVANADHTHAGVTSINTRQGAVTLAATDVPVFVASGASHAPGAVPDPGASAGTTKFLREDSTWAAPAGGGGGGSLFWVEDVDAPTPSVENSDRIYSFQSGLAQAIYALVKVPASYIAGNPIVLKLTEWNADSSGTILLSALSTLLRPGTDLPSTTTNQRTTTNGAVTMSGANTGKILALDLDITDSSGHINGVAVAAGNLIRVKLFRGSDSATSDIKTPVYGAEVTFS